MSSWRMGDNQVCVPADPTHDSVRIASDGGCRRVAGNTCTLVGGGAGQVMQCPSATVVGRIPTFTAGEGGWGRVADVSDPPGMENDPVYVGRIEPVVITARSRRPAASAPGASPMPAADGKPAGSEGVYTYGQEPSYVVAAWQGLTDAFGGKNGGAQQPQTGPGAQQPPRDAAPEIQQASVFPGGWIAIGGVAFVVAVGVGAWALWPRGEENA